MLRWIDLQIGPGERLNRLQQLLDGRAPFPTAITNLLLQRGLEEMDDIRAFMRPDLDAMHDPWELFQMDLAVNRVVEAVDRDEKILLYGDYDVDGTTSVALLKSFFSDWGIEVEYYIPDRYKEGYGISFEGMQYAIREKYNLVIALDCGTKAVDKVRYAKMAGVDIIIVDHHRPGAELPASVAMINPLQDGCHYPCKHLSACGLTLKFAEALNELFGEAFPERIPSDQYDPVVVYCDLVTLSIACDIVPILDENRIVAYHGLQKLKSNPLPGIASLMALSEHSRKWNISDLVFFLGPRINSAGRLRSARTSVQLLLGDPEERDEFASALHSYNDERRGLDRDITLEALEMIRKDPIGETRYATVLNKSDWHKGVIGIVASRLVEHYHRPTVMLTQSQGKWVGSARSVPGFDLYAALLECKAFIEQFGGHKYAAGMTIREEALPQFKQRFEEVVQSRMTPELRLPILEVAHRLDFREITPKFFQVLRMLAPFGPGNPEPVFLAQDVRVLDVRILKEDHVRFQLEQDGIRLEAIGFNLARRWRDINALQLNIAYQPDEKEWKGNTYLQLKLKDFKAS